MEPISKCWGWVSELVWQLETHLCPVQGLHLSFSDIRVAGGKPCLKLKYSVLSSKWPSGSASPGLDGPSSSSTLCNQWSLPPLHPHLSCHGNLSNDVQSWDWGISRGELRVVGIRGAPWSCCSGVGRWRQSSCLQPDEMRRGTEVEASSLGSLLGVG